MQISGVNKCWFRRLVVPTAYSNFLAAHARWRSNPSKRVAACASSPTPPRPAHPPRFLDEHPSTELA
eukprot:2838603-Prymnesium_polylepis.1